MTSTPLLRDLLASTALDLGPQAPTLCDPWRVRDLMAHLVVRESRPDVLPGIGLDVGPLRRHTDQVQDRVAGRRDLPQLAEAVRRGPARWWPTSVGAVDDLVNVPELAVHLEDMVRAQPDWEPTRLSEEVQRALWTSVRHSGRMLYGRAPVGVANLLAFSPAVNGRWLCHHQRERRSVRRRSGRDLVLPLPRRR